MDRYVAAPSCMQASQVFARAPGAVALRLYFGRAHSNNHTAGEVVEWTMATQTASWMTDAQWLCCKTCRTHSAQGGTFVVSSCGHIFCTSCKERAPSGTCQHCGRNNVEYVELTTDITDHPKIGHYFGMLEEMGEKLLKLLKFQHFHQSKFWNRDGELPGEDDLVRLFGDLARTSLEDVQSNAAASMSCVRQLEGQKAMASQYIEQHTQEGRQIEEELRKMGVNSGSFMGSSSQSENQTPSTLLVPTTPSSVPRVAPFPPTPSPLLPPPLPPPLPGSLSPANGIPPSPYTCMNQGMPPPRQPPTRINQQNTQNVLTSSPAMSSRCHPTSQLSARLVQMSAARTQRQMVPSTPREMPNSRDELPHPSKLPRTRTPQGMHSPSPSPYSTPHNYLGGQQLFRGAKVSATVSRKYPNGVPATTPSPVVMTTRRPPSSGYSQLNTPDYAMHKACLTPPSTRPRRLSVRGPPVDGKIGTIPNRTTPSSSMLQLIQASGVNTSTACGGVTPNKSSGRRSTSYQPMGHSIVRPAYYQHPVQAT